MQELKSVLDSEKYFNLDSLAKSFYPDILFLINYAEWYLKRSVPY